ncbi:MAG: zinc-binding dehydrogenase [Kibdelosporangium sp.]
MKAALLYGPADLRVEEVPDRTPGPGEVLVRVTASGVCPSDIRTYTGSASGSRAPWTPGHEVAGVVAAAGPDVELAEGDGVVLDWRGVCGVCRECRRGAANFCAALYKYPIAGFAEYTTMPVTQTRSLPPGLSAEAACFAEPLACVVNAHRAIPLDHLGDDLLVIGAGPIGLLHTQVARSRGARVIVADTRADRLETAKQVGAHDVVEVDGDAGEDIRALTEGRGADAVVVTVGAPAVISSSLGMAARNGTVNLFAGTHPKGTFELDPDIPHYDQISLTGSHDFAPADFTAALRLLQFGMVDTGPLVTHRFGLEDVRAAFETTRAQTGLKSIIVSRQEGSQR